jgi:uncharacterized protein (DUF983 family)
MEKLIAMFSNKCPVCGQGKIFKSGHFFKFGATEKHCSECNHRFEKEPGFFMGAMYVSYGFALAELFSVFSVCQLFFDDFFDLRILLIQVTVVLILAPFNFRISRVCWIYLFTKTAEPKKLVKLEDVKI